MEESQEYIEPNKTADATKPFASGGSMITMAHLPQKFKVDKDLAARLRKLNDKQQGVQQFVALVTRQGEERLAEMMHEGRGLWNDIATRHGIDIENVQWNLDKDGETITPVGMKL